MRKTRMGISTRMGTWPLQKHSHVIPYTYLEVTYTGTSRWTNLGPPISYEPGSTDVKQIQNYITIIAGIVMCVHILYTIYHYVSAPAATAADTSGYCYSGVHCGNVIISRLSGVRHTATATLKSLFVPYYLCVWYVQYNLSGRRTTCSVSCSNGFRHNII